MPEKLEELVQYIRDNVPQAKIITHLEVKDSMQAVTFRWHSMEFLVKASLEVFQVKEQKIYITAGSMLMQAVLQTAGRIDRVMEGSVSSLEQVVDFLQKRDVSNAMKMLDPIKKVLQRYTPRR